MTTGAKAGLAVGIVAGLAAIITLIFFCIRKRRQASERQRLDDEKYIADQSAFKRTASTRTSATAPRLSLRPVTQFSPNLSGNRMSQGNLLGMSSNGSGAAQGMQNLSPDNNYDRSGSNGYDRSNPFGNHAETVDAVNAAGPHVLQDGAEIVGAGAGAVAAGGLTRNASKLGNGPKPLDFTKSGPFLGPPSPTGTDFSEASELPGTPVQTNGASAIAAAGGPANSAVHRVQLDFKPSMGDELELTAGQLVRLLHEYDDGWVSFTNRYG
jgi:hypothetical protein